MRGRVVRHRRWSVRVDARTLAVCVVLCGLIVAVGTWSIAVGDLHLPVRTVVRTLLGGGTDNEHFVVVDLRLPRILTGVLVGAAFGVSGAIFQSLAHNPLGSPDVIGFNTGAALGAVVMIVVVGGESGWRVSFGAVVGGLLTALVVYLCAWKRGVQPYRLVLVGIGVGFALSAGCDFLLTRAELLDAQRAGVWLRGSLNARGWEHVVPAAIGLGLLAPIVLLLGRSMRLLELGDDIAAGLGVRVGRTRLVLVVVGVGLAAVGTAAAGPIGFVALVCPPIARRLVRAPGVTLVPSALAGALLTVAADLIARRIVAPAQLPAGVATAALGAPYLLWLLAREIRRGTM